MTLRVPSRLSAGMRLAERLETGVAGRRWATRRFGFPHTLDEAIRLVVKLAMDVGDLPRARALIEVLEAKPRSMSVLALVTRKPGHWRSRRRTWTSSPWHPASGATRRTRVPATHGRPLPAPAVGLG